MIVLTETHLREGQSSIFKNPLVDLRKKVGYAERARGGLMILAEEAHRIETQVIHQDPDNNYAIIKYRELVIAAAYLAPSLDDDCISEFVERAVSIAEDYGNDLIIVGDLNARVGSLAQDIRFNRRGRILITLLQEKDLILHRPEVGRWTCTNWMGNSVVDHVIGNGAALSEYEIVPDCLGGSDHRPLLFGVNTGEEPQKNFSRWNVRRFVNKEIKSNYQRRLTETGDGVKRFLATNEDVDVCWRAVKAWIEETAKETCGKLHFRNTVNKEFWTENLRREKRELVERIIAMEALSSTNNQRPILDIARRELMEAQKNYRNLLIERRNMVFQEMVNNLSLKQNASTLMKYVRNNRARKSRSNSGLDPMKTNDYREHFLTTFGGQPLGTTNTEPIIEQAYESRLITEEEVAKVVRSVTMGRAAGPDGLMSEFFYYGGSIMNQVLQALLQKIADKCQIPVEWREANVALIFKNKGDRKEVVNYRPISLTVTARRIYERIIKKDLQQAERLLAHTQGGFRKKRSTLHQVYSWAEFNHNEKFKNVLLDLKAAYDLVDRRILWNKLANHYRVPYSTIKRLQSLFDHNESYLVINGTKSRGIKCERGLMQGSSLSPILFNLFINELLMNLKTASQITKCGIKINNLAFADDIILMAKNATEMSNILTICEVWSTRVGMRFSPTKCIALDTEEQNFSLYNQRLTTSENEKYLGINIVPGGINFPLLGKERTDIAKGLIMMMGSMGLNLNGFAPEASSRLYKTFIRPAMEYGLALKQLSAEEIKTYQKTQNMALRMIFSVPRNTSIEAMHKLAQVEPMETRNQILNLEFAGRIHNSTDKTIPATRIWRSQIQDLPRNSLTYWAKKNNLWDKGSWLNHLLNPLGNQAVETELECLEKSQKKMICRKAIMELSKGDSNVAGAIEIVDLEKHRYITLSNNNIPKKRRMTITRWILGVVARHQNCRNCDAGNEVNRDHAIDCSGAGEYLARIYDAIPVTTNYNIIDYLLNIHRHSPNMEFYENMENAISMIYRKCLHCEQSENGFWTSRHQENAPAGVG